MTNAQFLKFMHEYSSKFYHAEHDEILENLMKSEILIKSNGLLKYRYKYIYYFYAAKYLADNIGRCLHHVDDIWEKLHMEVYANILIFLLHHSKDERIIDKVKGKAEQIYADMPVASLDVAETRHIALVLGDLPKLVMSKIDVETARRRSLLRQDKVEGNSVNEADDDFHRSEDRVEDPRLIEVKHSARMIDVIGQVLRNRFGSFMKADLAELAECDIGSGLRFLSYWLDFTRRQEDVMVNLIVAILLDGDDKDSNDIIARRARNLYLAICYEVCRGVLLRIVNSRLNCS